MTLAQPDDSGRPFPVEVPGGRVTIELDTLIVAIGQRAGSGCLFGHPGRVLSQRLSRGRSRTLSKHRSRGSTRVATCADPGPSNIVDACGDGRRIARAILEREGLPTPPPTPVAAPVLDLPDLLRRRSHREPRVKIPRVAGADRGAFDEVVATLGADAAAVEAGRCLDCDLLCSTCDGVCPNRAIATYFLDPQPRSSSLSLAADQTAQVAVMADFCNECGNCATFCPTMGRPWRDKPRIYFDRGGFEAEDDNAFMLVRINGLPGIQGRFRGVTKQLTLRLSTPMAETPQACHSERAQRGEESPEARTDAERSVIFVPSGDPSTHSSNSFAQGDLQSGDSETHENESDPEVAIMRTLLHGLTRSLPHLPMPEAETGWLVTPG